MDLIRAHQMVEAGHRHDAYAMVVNYAMTQHPTTGRTELPQEMPDTLAGVSRCGRQSLWIEKDLTVSPRCIAALLFPLSYPSFRLSAISHQLSAHLCRTTWHWFLPENS